MFNTSFTSTFTFAGPSVVRHLLQQLERVPSTPVSLSVARSATTSSAFASRPKASIGKTRARWRSVGSARASTSTKSRSWGMSTMTSSRDRRSSLYRRRRRCGVPQRGRSRRDAAEHAVRLSGHHRRGLEHRSDVPPQPGRPLLRHDGSQLQNQGSLGDTQYNLTYSPQNNNVSAMLSLHMRFGVAAPPPRRRRRRWWRRRRSWCSSTGTARTCRSRR